MTAEKHLWSVFNANARVSEHRADAHSNAIADAALFFSAEVSDHLDEFRAHREDAGANSRAVYDTVD